MGDRNQFHSQTDLTQPTKRVAGIDVGGSIVDVTYHINPGAKEAAAAALQSKQAINPSQPVISRFTLDYTSGPYAGTSVTVDYAGAGRDQFGNISTNYTVSNIRPASGAPDKATLTDHLLTASVMAGGSLLNEEGNLGRHVFTDASQRLISGLQTLKREASSGGAAPVELQRALPQKLTP